MTPTQPAFQQSEFESRLARARQALAAEGLAACLVMAPEHLYYFGAYESWVAVNSPQAMILTPQDDSPILLLRDVDLPLALESTWIEDIRTYHLVNDNFAQRVRDCLIEKGVRQGKVGVELSSYAVTAALGRNLDTELGAIELIDTTQSLGNLRLHKSAAEMACMEAAARCANQGLKAMRENLEEGISEIQLAGAIEKAMRDAGSDYWAIPTELASGNRSAGGHATPRARLIQLGDLVHAEFAGVCDRYHATAIQTLSLGEPGARARELYNIALASLKAGIAVTTLGAEVAAIEEASLQPLRSHGLEQAAMMRFGYGVGIAYPPIWLETLQIARGFDYRLEPGMTFVLHSCLELPAENLGVILGGTWAMTEKGLQLLAGAGPCELEVL